MASLTTELVLPYPHPGQVAVRAAAKRINVLSAGRRWRKTTLVMAIAVESAALLHQRVIWGAPTYDQVRVGWEETRHAAGQVAKFNQAQMSVTFPGGGSILFRSLDNPDNARGHTADGVVVDEAGDVAERAWYEVLRPMMLDTGGWAWLVGTPKGRNWFWREFTQAEDRPDTAAFSAPTLGVAITEAGLIRQPHPLALLSREIPSISPLI
jgi:phage terminase large subunit